MTTFIRKDTIVSIGTLTAKDPLGDIIVFDGLATSLIESVCCSCNEHLGFKDGRGNYGLSHAYCPGCLDIIKAQYREQLEMVI